MNWISLLDSVAMLEEFSKRKGRGSNIFLLKRQFSEI